MTMTEFTDDEIGILRLLAQNKTTNEIQKITGLNETDIIKHFKRMRSKVVGGKHSDLIRYAKELENIREE